MKTPPLKARNAQEINMQVLGIRASLPTPRPLKERKEVTIPGLKIGGIIVNAGTISVKGTVIPKGILKKSPKPL